jgi:hypothetical protein
VYLLEGLATIIFSGVVWFVLPDYPKSPRSNKWLSEREQNFIEIRLSENAPLTHDPVFTKSEIVESLKTPIIWAFMISQMLVNLAGYALQWYLPTITTNLGFASLPKNQLLNIPPAAAALLGIIFSSYFINSAIITRPAYIAYVPKSDHCDYNSRANPELVLSWLAKSYVSSYFSLSHLPVAFMLPVSWVRCSTIYTSFPSGPGDRPL